MIGLLDAASNMVTNYKKQLGTESHVARSCRDIHLAFPNLKDGYYYVDPNEGCNDDRIHVYCEFSRNATCVDPKKKEMPLQELKNIEETGYGATDSQFKFLRLLSIKAYQNVTFNCNNLRDCKKISTARIQSYTERELIVDTTHGKSTMKIETKKRDLLPFTNIPDLNVENRELKVTIGRVCFA